MSELAALVVATALTVARPSTVGIVVRWDVAPVVTVSSSAAIAIAVAAFAVVAVVAVALAVVLIRRNQRRQGTPPPTTPHSPQG